MWPTQPLYDVGDYVSIIMMLLITRVARGVRRHGSGRTTRGDHADHAAAAGEARDGENFGPHMASSVTAVRGLPAGTHDRPHRHMTSTEPKP